MIREYNGSLWNETHRGTAIERERERAENFFSVFYCSRSCSGFILFSFFFFFVLLHSCFKIVVYLESLMDCDMKKTLETEIMERNKMKTKIK